MSQKVATEELQEQLLDLLLRADKMGLGTSSATNLAQVPEVSADRLHRAVAFLAVKVAKADPGFDDREALAMLDQRRSESDYHHHDFIPEDAEFPPEQSFMNIAKGSCRVCGAVKPRDPRLADLPCRGPAVLSFR